MMTNEELILKAKEAKNAEELLALAEENGVKLTEENAKAYFERLNQSGELSDDDLDNVSGGACYTDDNYLWVTMLNGCKYWRCWTCKGKEMRETSPGIYKHTCNNNERLCVCATCEYSTSISDDTPLVCSHEGNKR